MPELPPHTNPILGVDRSTIDAIKQQLDLAQNSYDPDGIFCQQRASDWAVTATRNTSDLDLPHTYRSANTRLTAVASRRRGIAEPFVVATIKEDTFSTLEDTQKPIVQHLLRTILGIDADTLSYQPHAVLQQLDQAPHIQWSTFQRRIVQKTFDPDQTGTKAVHMTLNEMGAPTGPSPLGYAINFGRPVTIGDSHYTYWQYISCDDPSLPLFYGQRTAFAHPSPVPLGEQYQLGGDMVELQATGIAPSGLLSLRGLESYLQQGTNQLVGTLHGSDLNRLITEPLNASLQLA